MFFARPHMVGSPSKSKCYQNKSARQDMKHDETVQNSTFTKIKSKLLTKLDFNPKENIKCSLSCSRAIDICKKCQCFSTLQTLDYHIVIAQYCYQLNQQLIVFALDNELLHSKVIRLSRRLLNARRYYKTLKTRFNLPQIH